MPAPAIVTLALSAPSDPADPITAIYRQHHGWLLRWLRGKLQCADQAADLAHDTFVRLLTSTPSDQPDHQFTLREPRAYLTTVAQRLVIDHYRRLSLEQAWLDTLAHVPELTAMSPEEQLDILQTLHRIDAMLDGLPVPVRSAFLLSHLEGLNHAEIAARLEISARRTKRPHGWCGCAPKTAASQTSKPGKRGAAATRPMKRHGSAPSCCATAWACCHRPPACACWTVQ